MPSIKKLPHRNSQASSQRSSLSSRQLLDDITSAVDTAILHARESDTEREYLTTRAPNAIEWIVSPEYCNQPSLFNGLNPGSDFSPPFWGTYEFIRDIFELRCPICNRGPKSMFGTTKDQLLREVLLRYDAAVDDDRCPKCQVLRADLVEDGLFKGYNAATAVMGMRCTSLESLLYTNKGLLKFGELSHDAGRDVAEISLEVVTKNGRGKASMVGRKKAQRPLRVTTSLGWWQDVSHEHKFFIPSRDRWVKAEDLRPGKDKISLTLGAELFGTEVLPAHEARILGFLIANGDTSDKYRVRCDTGDHVAMTQFTADLDLLSRYVDLSYRVTPKSGGGLGLTCEVSRMAFASWVHEKGISPEWRACTKEVPLSVRRGTRETVIAFLEGYLSGDGFACREEKGGRLLIGFDSVSLTLATQLRLLLLNLGILTRANRLKTRGFQSIGLTTSMTNHVVVCGAYNQLFAKFFRLSVNPLKKAVLHDALERPNRRQLSHPPKSIDVTVRSVIEQDEAIPMADICVEGEHCYVANGFLQHNSGKTYSSAYLCSYVEHVLLTIAHRQKDNRGLQAYLGLPESQQIDMAFVASSLKTTEESMWQAYKGMRQSSPWFQRYTPWIKLQEKLQDTPVGMQKWTYIENDNEIHNGAVKLVANAYAAASGTIVGRTRILGGADEIGRMKDTDSSVGADEIYRGMEASLLTVRAAVGTRKLSSTRWMGFMLSVSSPTSIFDKSMRLLADAERVPRMYSMHRATWEFNPYISREHPEVVEAYLKDPVGAERDFGANPPTTKSPLILDKISFEEAAIDWTLEPTATFRIDGWSDETERYRYVGPKVVSAKFELYTPPRYIAFDPAATFDSYAGACGHAELDDDGRVVTVFDWVLRVLPPPGHEVWFDGAPEIIEELNKFYRIARVEFDQWNSLQPQQKIRNLGIPAEETKMNDRWYIQFYRDALAGRVKMLPPTEENYDIIDPALLSGAGAALYELESLDRDIDGKISNPRKGEVRGKNSDDCAQVIVRVHHMVQSIGITEKYDDQSRRGKRIRAEALLSEWDAKGAGTVWHPSKIRGGGGRGW